MSPVIPLLRYAGPGLEARPDEWMNQAACIGRYEDFSKIPSLESAPPWVRSESALIRYNKKRFRAAVKICKSCPVLEQCRDSATSEDYAADMVRAGRFPRGFGRGRGRPDGYTDSEARPIVSRGKLCVRGHDRWRKRASTSGYLCVECKHLLDRAKYNGEPMPPQTVLSFCRNGHDKSVTGVFPDGRCRACRLEAYERRRAAKMEG